MNILFLGDYSNLHACVASELRERGNNVTLISDGGTYMQTEYDIKLFRPQGIAGTAKYIFKLFSLIPKIQNYDIVQLINPHFLSLKPGKIKYFFDLLKKQNDKIFLTLAGDDYHFVKACLGGETFRFSEFKVGHEDTPYQRSTSHGTKWTCKENEILEKHIYENIDGAMSVLPEYDMAARPILRDKVTFTNIPVNLAGLPWRERDFKGKLKIFIGMRSGMAVQKGTDILLDAAQRLQREYPRLCEVQVARDLPLKEYLSRMATNDIALDQLYSYSPGTNGFQAMALGLIAGTGAQPEFYDYIKSPTHPLLALSPLQDPYDQIKELILNREGLTDRSRQAREIVEKNNDVKIVTDKFEQHWRQILK